MALATATTSRAHTCAFIQDGRPFIPSLSLVCVGTHAEVLELTTRKTRIGECGARPWHLVPGVPYPPRGSRCCCCAWTSSRVHSHRVRALAIETRTIECDVGRAQSAREAAAADHTTSATTNRRRQQHLRERQDTNCANANRSEQAASRQIAARFVWLAPHAALTKTSQRVADHYESRRSCCAALCAHHTRTRTLA